MKVIYSQLLAKLHDDSRLEHTYMFKHHNLRVVNGDSTVKNSTILLSYTVFPQRERLKDRQLYRYIERAIGRRLKEGRRDGVIKKGNIHGEGRREILIENGAETRKQSGQMTEGDEESHKHREIDIGYFLIACSFDSSCTNSIM